MRRLFLLGGHNIVNGRGTGAHNAKFGYDEAVIAAKLRDDIVSKIRERLPEAQIFTETSDAESNASVISKLSALFQPRDILVDLHFNSFTNDAVSGTETFIPKKYTQFELKLANSLSDVSSKVLGITSRRSRADDKLPAGVKLETETQHGEKGLLVTRQRCECMLHEVCFLSNPKDMEKFFGRYETLTDTYCNVFINFMTQA